MRKLILIVALLMLPLCASAQLIIDPVGKTATGINEFGATLGFSEVDYELDNNGSSSVDREYLGFSLAHGLSEDLDVYVAGGYIIKAEVGDSGSDDDGMLLAAGVRSKLSQVRELSFHGYAQVQYLAEDYGNDFSGDLFETNLGVISRVNLFDPLALYAGLDLTPISQGSIDTPVGDFDFERDDLVGIRLGADLLMPGWKLRAEYALISEETFTLGFNMPI